MPFVKQRGLLLMGNFSFQVNSKVGHDMWFNNSPWGPADSWAASFLDLGQKAGGKTMALLAADQEFAQNLALTARDVAKKRNISIVYDQSYPPNTVEFASIIRSLKAAKPDIVYVASYPPDSAGILRAVNEIGIGDDVKIFGGGMVGLQFAAVMQNLGSLLNGVTNYNTWLPEQSMYHEGTKAFFDVYTKRAVEAKVDPLGFYLAPFGYAMGQMIEAAVNVDKVARPEGACQIFAREPAQDHRRTDRLCGGWRVEGNRDAAGAIPGCEGQGHRTVPILRQAGDPVPG